MGLSRRQSVLGVLAVFAVATALRLLSLYWSPLPFNPDGILYAADARATLAADRLPLARLPTDSVGFTALLAVVAEVTGVRPLYVGQPLAAVVGAASCLVAVAVARRIAVRTGWSRSRATLGGLLAGGLLAVDGLYVYRSMATDETTVGLVVVPAFVLAAVRAIHTGQRRWAGVAAVLLVSLPPMHNHAGVVAALALMVLAGLWVVRARTPRAALAATAVAGGGWLLALGYHPFVAALTPMRVIQSDLLSRTPGLFVAWVVLVVIGGVWLVTTGRRTQRGVVAVTIATWFLALAANAVLVVYPGTTATPPGL